MLTLSYAASGLMGVFIGLGLYTFLVREIASDPARAPRLAGAAVTLQSVLSLPVLGATLLVLRLGVFHGEEALAVLLGWVVCLSSIISIPLTAAFQAIERMRYLAYFGMLTTGATALTGLVAVILGVRAIGVLTSGIVVGAAATCLSLVWARPYLRIGWITTRREVWRMLVASLPYWSVTALYTGYVWLDSFMLGLMTPSAVVGWYGLTTRLLGTLLIFSTILCTAWLPQLVTAHRSGLDHLYRAARPAIETVLILSMPVCVGAVLVAGPLVRALYGEGFSGAIPVLALLALCVPPMSLNIMANQVMIARNRQMVWTRMMLMVTILNLGLNLALIPYFQRRMSNGAIGAAVALLASEVVEAVIAGWLVRATFNRASLVRLLKAMCASGVMGVVVIVALRGGLALAVLAGMASFPLLVAALRVLSEEERRQLGVAVRSVGRRLGLGSRGELQEAGESG